MPSEIYMLCNAYESGVGHGLQQDGHDSKNGTLYASKDLNEAYQIGYEFGVVRALRRESSETQQITGL